jgi:hypothetical protein
MCTILAPSLKKRARILGLAWKSCGIALVIATCLFESAASRSQAEKGIEYRFKAAYILNFLRFVEWPDSVLGNDQTPLVLVVLGEDPFGKVLDETFQSETIGGHPIVIKRYRSWHELGPCQALFVSASEKEAFPEILKYFGGSSILTISDIKGFGDNGGGINFFLEDNKLRFEINVRALRQADLKASSKLLRLARIINPKE